MVSSTPRADYWILLLAEVSVVVAVAAVAPADQQPAIVPSVVGRCSCYWRWRRWWDVAAVLTSSPWMTRAEDWKLLPAVVAVSDLQAAIVLSVVGRGRRNKTDSMLVGPIVAAGVLDVTPNCAAPIVAASIVAAVKLDVATNGAVVAQIVAAVLPADAVSESAEAASAASAAS